MPQFKVRHNGSEEVVTAARSAVDGSVTLFESPTGGAWKVVKQFPTVEIEGVQRRVVEASGMARWITEKPKRVAASRTWV